MGINDFTIHRHERTASLTASTVFMLAGIAVNEMIQILSGAKASSKTCGTSLYINTDSLTFSFTDYQPVETCACQ